MSVTPVVSAAMVLKWNSDVFLALGSNYWHLNLYIYRSINKIENRKNLLIFPLLCSAPS